VKLTTEPREIEVCDFCRRERFLQTCIVCGRQYCLTDQGTVPGCWVGPNVCRKCDEREDVKKVCDKYANQITPIVRKRNDALKRLPAEAGHGGGE